MTEEYITQFPKEIEGWVTKKLSQEIKKNRVTYFSCSVHAKQISLEPVQVRTSSGTVPGKSRDNDLQHREPTGDRSQNDPHPKMELSTRRTSNSPDSDQEKPTTVTVFNESS